MNETILMMNLSFMAIKYSNTYVQSTRQDSGIKIEICVCDTNSLISDKK